MRADFLYKSNRALRSINKCSKINISFGKQKIHLYPSILYGFVGVSERCGTFCRSGERNHVLWKADCGATVSDEDSTEKTVASAEYFREGGILFWKGREIS